MPFASQKFIDTRTGEIVVQVPISEICHFEEYGGPLQAGDFKLAEPKKSDWLDDHLVIIGVPDDAANKIKDRLRREF